VTPHVYNYLTFSSTTPKYHYHSCFYIGAYYVRAGEALVLDAHGHILSDTHWIVEILKRCFAIIVVSGYSLVASTHHATQNIHAIIVLPTISLKALQQTNLGRCKSCTVQTDIPFHRFVAAINRQTTLTHIARHFVKIIAMHTHKTQVAIKSAS
jgi:hypothetical protein